MNEQIFRFLNTLAFENTFIGETAVFLAQDFGVLLLVVAFIFFLFHKHGDNGHPETVQEKALELVLIFGTICLAWGINYLIKHGVSSPRPFLALENVHTLIVHGGYDSFPSGHTALFSALGACVYYFHKRLGLAFMVAAILVGIGRIAAGIHYPIDIFGGFIIGASVTYVVLRFAQHRIVALKP